MKRSFHDEFHHDYHDMLVFQCFVTNTTNPKVTGMDARSCPRWSFVRRLAQGHLWRRGRAAVGHCVSQATGV